MFNLSKRAVKIFQSPALISPIYSCHKRRPLHPDRCPPIKCLTPTHPKKVLNYSKPAPDSLLEGSCRSGQTQSLHQNLCWKLKSDFASHDVPCFAINNTCRHRQYCHHLCPSGQDSGFQDNCRTGPQSRPLNSIFSLLKDILFLF